MFSLILSLSSALTMDSVLYAATSREKQASIAVERAKREVVRDMIFLTKKRFAVDSHLHST